MARLVTCSICGKNEQESKGAWQPTCDTLGNPLYIHVCSTCSKEGRRG